MKTSTKISLIAMASTLALVGTAFAAWEFNKSAQKALDSNVTITKDASVGEITLNPATFYLTLDQDTLAWTESSHTDDEAAITDTITTIEFKYTGSAKSGDVSDVTLEVEAPTVDAALAEYITVGAGSLGTPTEAANVKTATYTLPTLAWKDGKKPTTQAKFDTMKTAVASAKVSFTFKATVA